MKSRDEVLDRMGSWSARRILSLLAILGLAWFVMQGISNTLAPPMGWPSSLSGWSRSILWAASGFVRSVVMLGLAFLATFVASGQYLRSRPSAYLSRTPGAHRADGDPGE